MTALLNQDKDTICALATAQGMAGISVIRVSGEESVAISRKVCPFLPEQSESHRVYYGKLSDPKTSSFVDEVLVSYFAKGRSFTGEDTIEISLHGNPNLVSYCLELLVQAGARPAERGEFTFRGFMNGRIDLVQAEGVLDLIQSQTRKAAALSLRQLEGGLSSRLSLIKSSTTEILAHLEANIDFSSEDIVVAANDHLIEKTKEVISEIEALLRGYQAGRILKSGYRVVLAGRPNVGKSSLLNALMDEEKAIVTPIEGTTRDLIEGQMILEGYKIDLTDTAGIRESRDEIETIGQDRALQKIQNADLVLMVLDGTQDLSFEDSKIMESLDKAKTILVLNKMDLGKTLNFDHSFLAEVEISAKSGQGLQDLKKLILDRLLRELPTEEDSVSLNTRHFNHLTAAKKMLGDALTLMVNDQSPDFIALELHGALREIYSILGEVYDDQVMDEVFNQFCIGK